MNKTERTNSFIIWTSDSGQANVPQTIDGRAWIEEANRIMDLPENDANVEQWDDHSIELQSIGGFWS